MKQKVFNVFDGSIKKKGIILFIIIALVLSSLLSYSSSDNCLNVVGNVKTKNFLGSFGAIISDILYQYLGFSVFCFFPFYLYLSYNFFFKKQLRFIGFKIVCTFIFTLCVSFIFGFTMKYQYYFSIPLGGKIGVFLNKLCNTDLLHYTLILFSIFFVFIYPYIAFIFGNKPKKQFFRNSKITFLPLFLYKMLYFFEKISTISGFIVKIPFKILRLFFFKKKQALKEVKIADKQPCKENNKKAVAGDGNFDKKYIPPVPSLLKIIENDGSAQSQLVCKNNLEKLSTILGDFGVRGDMIGYKSGPIVTLYEFKPQAGIKASRVISLSDDTARTMMVSSVRIATISGRDTLGIEVPNKNREIVCFRKLIESEEYVQTNANIPMILGCNIFGKPIVADLTDMPHLLIAGTTGSGKSVGINGMILSMLYKLSPEECKLIMIDPKMLEFSAYEGIPHLMLPVITDAKNAVLSLKWAVREMENRYHAMSEAGVRNITSYNQKINSMKQKTFFDKDGNEVEVKPMHYIVIIIDEMADLMVVAGKEIEVLVQRLSQMARAAGIHLIMATQRPSVDVITGVIKANFPTRISYHVTSKIDSRTILGEQGAEQLLGKGDMLFMLGGTKTLRVHGPMITDDEVENVVEYLKKNNDAPEYISIKTDENEGFGNKNIDDFNDNGDEFDLYKQAVKIVISENKTSISYLQRKLRIGYNKAANFIEKMEEEGILSSPDRSGKRVIIKENND